MAYSEAEKYRAYNLYLVGQNSEQIGKMLGISSNTIRAWETEEDKLGETWKDKRAQIDSAARSRMENHMSSIRGKLKGKASIIMEVVYTGIVDEANKILLKAKDLPSAVYAWKSLAGFFLQLDDEDSSRFNPLQASQSFLETLEEFPAVSRELKKVWPEFTKSLARKLNIETQTREIEGAVSGPVE